jgi:hypothetical protein
MKYSGVVGSGHITDKEIRNQKSCPLPHFRCEYTIVSLRIEKGDLLLDFANEPYR